MSYQPRKVWMVTEYMTTTENGREVLDHPTARPLAATFVQDVAEILLAEMKDRKGDETIILSEIQTPPAAVLKVLEPEPRTEEEEIPSAIRSLLGE